VELHAAGPLARRTGAVDAAVRRPGAIFRWRCACKQPGSSRWSAPVHELSLAGGVLELLEGCAEQEGFRRVARLRLEVGKLSGVEVESLRFALESIAPGTCLEGAQVEIDEPAGHAWCLACDVSVPLEQHGEPCGRCGGWRLRVTGGTELKVVDLIVEDG
jgi:hydrogenase nickel incorporation protein HypA/HybF